MRGLEFITGHVIYNPAYTYKFQLKTTMDFIIEDCPCFSIHFEILKKPSIVQKEMETSYESKDDFHLKKMKNPITKNQKNVILGTIFTISSKQICRD